MGKNFIFRSFGKYGVEGADPGDNEVLRCLWDVTIDDMNDNELDNLYRTFSHGITCIRREIDKKRKTQKEKVTSDMRSDMLIRDINHDHAYSKYSEDGEVFISEPYQLPNEDILSLATAIKEGYDVVIDGNGQHCPGRTFRVLVRKKTANELYDLVRWGNI